MNNTEELKTKLKSIKNIIITNHARDQAIFRSIDINEVKQNIINPIKLVYATRQKAENEQEFKYDCYFEYSKNQYHRYILVTNGECLICTVIKINRRWQKSIERRLK